MAHDLFSVHKRPSKKNRNIYYVQFWDPEQKRYGSAVSSGCTSRAAAREWAREEVTKGTAGLHGRRHTFGDFADGFYDWDSSSYVRTLRMQGRVHRSHIYTMALQLKNHILPVFKDLKFSEITPYKIESFLIDLHEREYSPGSIKSIYASFRGVVGEAVRLGLLRDDPCLRVRKPRSKKRPTKGVFTESEAKILLEEDTLDTVWGLGTVGILHYTINLLAASTGLRMGEIQGIRIGKIDLEAQTAIINETWERIYGTKGTKTEQSDRIVSLSSKVVKYLRKLLYGRTDSEEFVFPATRRLGAPIGHTAIGDHFQQACERAGIDREGRRITFHSWRHFWDSCLLNKGVPVPTVMRVLGHATEGMTAGNYYHVDAQVLKQIRTIQEDIV